MMLQLIEERLRNAPIVNNGLLLKSNLFLEYYMLYVHDFIHVVNYVL